MRLTEEEALKVFSALRDQALSKDECASQYQSVGMNSEAKQLIIEAEALRELASKISKAQEADDNEVPA